MVCQIEDTVVATNPTYEYKTWTNPNNYIMGEDRLEGHKFGYIKRRRYQSDSTFREFQPKCSCKTKNFQLLWFTGRNGTDAKDKALHCFNEHVRIMRNFAPTLMEQV
jgi:hypothetical protein